MKNGIALKIARAIEAAETAKQKMTVAEIATLAGCKPCHVREYLTHVNYVPDCFITTATEIV